MKVFTVFVFIYLKLLLAYDIRQHPNWHLIDHEHCGESITDRIIGGEEASLGQFPWMVRLAYEVYYVFFNVTVFTCAGSLINKLYVVTAAHCVTNLDGDVLVFVRLGEHNADTEIDCEDDMCAPPVQDFRPVKQFYHRDYQHPPLRHDIALIRLDRPAKLNEFVFPICLPQGPLLHKNYVGNRATVAGWGLKDVETQTSSNVLLHVQLPIVDPKLCQVSLGSFTTFGKGQLCAGGLVGYDSCGGDSGGPLMKAEAVDGPPRYYLIGIVSFGSVDCGSDYPATYTDVAYYLPWILNNMEP